MQILNTAREELCTQTVVLFAQAVNAANAPILPIMLSTMALPEMEAEEKGLLSQLDASMAAMSDQELHASLAVCKSCLQQCVSDEGRAGCARGPSVYRSTHCKPACTKDKLVFQLFATKP